MIRKIVAVWMSLLMVFCLVGIIDISRDYIPIVKGTTVYVNTTGSGGAYTSIQDAINAANPGNTVFVYNGIYFENVVLNKTITLTGEDRDNTIINGGGSGNVVYVNVSWVNITGFTITGSGSSPGNAGINLENIQNCRIFENIASNNLVGIHIDDSDLNSITDNKASNNGVGISIYYMSTNNSIIGNNASSNSENGIQIFSSNGNYISDNTASLNILDGFEIRESNGNIVTKNNVLNNGAYGLDLYMSDGNTITDNTASNNDYGIVVILSDNNIIYHNNFIDNTNQVSDVSNGNQWDNGYPSGGNYWDNWAIPDNDRDGFVDNPYIITGGLSQDNYPFSHKWGWDLVAHWPFDENMGQYANETSGNYNDGILGGTTNVEDADPDWVNGISGSALKFDCVDDYVKVPASDSLNITGNLTIEAWIKPFSDGYDYIMWVVSKRNAYKMGLDSDSSKNHIRFELWTSPSSSEYFSSNGEVNPDRWNYIVVTISGYESKMYINGDMDRIIPGFNVYGVSTYNLSIGSESRGSSSYFNGIIDGVSIWNRVLTAFEIQDNYRNGIANSIYLSRGWNLISIPNILSDKNLSNVLSSINGSYDSVQYYNVSDVSDHWKHHHDSKPDKLNDLVNLDHINGFWLHVTTLDGVLFKYSGTQPTSNQTIQLHPGWNMVGYPSLTSHNRTKGLNNLTFDDQVDAIWSWDAANQKMEEMGESDNFMMGKGYYIHAKTNCEWEVPL
jgi:parallel beta-helix repeat protein